MLVEPKSKQTAIDNRPERMSSPINNPAYWAYLGNQGITPGAMVKFLGAWEPGGLKNLGDLILASMLLYKLKSFVSSPTSKFLVLWRVINLPKDYLCLQYFCFYSLQNIPDHLDIGMEIMFSTILMLRLACSDCTVINVGKPKKETYQSTNQELKQ